MANSQVRPNLPRRQDVSSALVVGWARMIATHGKGAAADAMEVDAKTLSRAMAGENTPALHTALSSLLVDPNALNEVFALYGLAPPRPRQPEAANDHHLMAELANLLRQFAMILEDGERDHRETLDLADQVRMVMPALSAILTEANRIRGIAA